jgi:hypothetical protein
MAASRTKKADGDGGAWVALAWVDRCTGKRSYDDLAAKYGHDRKTVAKRLKEYATQRAAELADGEDPTAHFVDSIEATLCEAWTLYHEATQESTRVAALKLIADTTTKLAAAQGVSTDRRTLGVGQDPALPPVNVEVDIPHHGELANLFRNAADLAIGEAQGRGLPTETGGD